ncbi:DsbA family protein [Sinisalibacter aestuarii]|uniref:DSBA oxidoreductase n=1 Tax=Sinisalibacter aestuarii TaxID=2949426 RepID=A0ABQ5LTY4_9RHOB|nr:DsbA family protein [Sinisalibacter aestuarii]GKY87880.1 DSBA oxidoreductase [Sinisalibacter aestuarii]
MTRRFLPALALAAGLAAAPAFAFDVGAMTDAERAAFREEVRAYLLENPEIIMEAVAVLERRQAAEQVANDAALVSTNHDAIFNDGYSYIGGNPEGDVTFVEFVDYKCGYCRKAFPELAQLIEQDGNIRIIYKEFPILGEESLLASRFAVSAKLIAGDDAYGRLHDAMMTMRGTMTTASLSGLAGDLGLDGEAIVAGMSDPQVDAIIGMNHELAGRLQISGTPTFVMRDQLLRGYVPLDGMVQIVAELRAAQ